MNYKAFSFFVSILYLNVKISLNAAVSQKITEDIVVISVYSGDLAILRQAIESGFEINYKTDQGVSLLMLAAIKCHVLLVRYLVSIEGANCSRLVDSEVKDCLGHTALDYATLFQTTSEEQILQKKSCLEILKAIKPKRLFKNIVSFEGSIRDLPGFESVESRGESGRTSRTSTVYSPAI